MSTKAEVVQAVDAALALANQLPDDQSAQIAELTQQLDAARNELAALKVEALALLDQLSTADQAEDAKRAELRAKLGG